MNHIAYSKRKYTAYFNVEHNGEWFTIGDHVTKSVGKTKFIGRILSIYKTPHDGEIWAVILLDKNEKSDHLQHVYPLRMFTHV
jgi:hypothetical protein